MRSWCYTQRIFGVLFALGFLSAGYAAVQNPAVGSWQTHDDVTGKPTSVITIWKSDSGKYYGKISKIYHPKQGERCEKCKGDLYNKPMLGLVIIRDMTVWRDRLIGGSILDPRDGKEYHCILQPSSDGKTLKVRGYIGLSLLGQTKIWYRINNPH